MEPLLKDKSLTEGQEAAWRCWLAHVRHLRFQLRHVYRRDTDCAELDRLHHDFLLAFAAVPQWQDRGYVKPKFHPAQHLSEVRRHCLARARPE